MARERSIFPFPHIPFGAGAFPGEERTGRITEANSSFNNPDIVRVVGVVKDFRQAVNRRQRDEALRRASDICVSNYPQSYEVFRRYLDDQISLTEDRAPEETTRLRSYQELQQVLAHEYEPPVNVRLTFQFEPHGIFLPGQREQVAERLKARLLDAFAKDERNIVFIEDSAHDPKKDEIFKRALQRFGSFLKAGAYYDAYRGLGIEPPEHVLPTLFQALNRPLHPHTDYALTVYSVLDELTTEGYSIEPIREKGRNAGSAETSRRKPNSLVEMKQMIKAQTDSDRTRESAIAKQLEQIIEDAVSSDQQTNIFMLLGSAHAPILHILPNKLQSIAQVEIRTDAIREGAQGKFVEKQYEVMMKLRSGQIVSEAEWMELYSFFQKI